MTVPRWLRRALPWIVGLVILVVIATRVPFDAFGDAIGQGPHLLVAGVEVLITLVILFFDSFATWGGLLALRIRRRPIHVLAMRGATMILTLVNHAVGQGGFGYYLAKSGEKPLRATAATLFLIGTNLATLLLLTLATWTTQGLERESVMWWTLVGSCIAFAVYLVVIAVAPGFLARRAVLAPLFESGLRGHGMAIAARLPHSLAMLIGIWIAMRAWGVPVPFETGVTLMPAVVIASVLPISPMGLGTTQAALVFFFADYAVGATADEREAQVLAFGIVHLVYGVFASVVIGLSCMPFARRAGVTEPPPPS